MAKGHELDVSGDAFGELRRSDDVQDDSAALRERFAEDGYLFIPGFYPRDEIAEARRQLTATLAEKGLLERTCRFSPIPARPWTS